MHCTAGPPAEEANEDLHASICGIIAHQAAAPRWSTTKKSPDGCDKQRRGPHEIHHKITRLFMHDARKKIHSYWARTDREDAVVQPEPQTYAQASTAEHLGLAPPDPIDDATRTMTTDDPAHGAPRLLFWIYEPDGLDADSTLVAVTKKTDRYVHYIDARGHQERIGRHRLKALLKGPRCDWFAPRTWEERALLEGVAEHSLTPASGVQQALEMRSGERRYADLQVDVKDAEAGVRA